MSAVDGHTLTGCGFLTAEGQAHFKASQGTDRTCRPAVRFVVESVVEICGGNRQ